MAVGTTEQPTDKKPGESPNISDEDFEGIISPNYPGGAPHQKTTESASSDKKNSAAGEALEKSEQVASENMPLDGSIDQLEANPTPPSIPTNFSKNGGSNNNRGGGALSKLRARQKQIAWVVGLGGVFGGLVVTVLMALGSLLNAPNLAMHINNLAGRFSQAVISRRMNDLSKRYFEVKDCSGKGVYCRTQRGVSDKEIDTFKKRGILTDEGVGQDNKGRKYIKYFSAIDENGVTQVTKENIGDFFGKSKNPAFTDALHFSKPRAILARGGQSVGRLVDWAHANLSHPLGKDNALDKLKQRFREYFYGKGDTRFKTGVASIDEQAAKEAESALKGEPTISDNVDSLKGTRLDALKGVGSSIKGAFGGVFKGVLGPATYSCEAYGLIRKVIIGAKIVKAAALIQYTLMFFTEIEAIKAGHGDPVRIAFLMSILLKPSTEAATKGKNFFNSNGMSILDGKIRSPDDMAKFSIASPRLNSLTEIKSYFQGAGINKNSCSVVQNPIVQLIAGGASVLIAALSGGTSELATLAAQFGVGFAVGFAVSYATPWLIKYAAGTVVPGYDSAGGGSDAGQAIFSGVAAGTMFIGRSNVLRPMTKMSLAESNSTLQAEIANQDAIDHLHKNPFSLNDPSSITSRLAFVVAPYVMSPFSNVTFQNLAATVISPFNLITNSTNQLLSHAAHAQTGADLQGEYCQDPDYIDMGLAVDAGCGVVHAMSNAELKISDEEAIKYMKDNQQLDETQAVDISAPATDQFPYGAKPKPGSDYEKFLSTCANGDIPYSPDGGGIEVTDNVDTKQCLSDDKKYQEFRVYAVDTIIMKSTYDDLNGNLGTTTDAGI